MRALVRRHIPMRGGAPSLPRADIGWRSASTPAAKATVATWRDRPPSVANALRAAMRLPQRRMTQGQTPPKRAYPQPPARDPRVTINHEPALHNPRLCSVRALKASLGNNKWGLGPTAPVGVQGAKPLGLTLSPTKKVHFPHRHPI